MKDKSEIDALKQVLEAYRKKGKVLLAYLYGSWAKGSQHKRSDIDLAVYIDPSDEKEAIEITDAILMTSEIPVEILRLDDGDESPFIVQEALKGIPLVDPDMDTLYRVAHRALHDCESIRFKRTVVQGRS